MAIAHDYAASSMVESGTTLTFPHACSGDNRLLLVWACANGTIGNDIVGATYNGIAMTPFQPDVFGVVTKGFYLHQSAVAQVLLCRPLHLHRQLDLRVK